MGWSFATGGFAGSGVVVVTISFSVVVVVTSSGVVNFSPSSSAVFSHSSLVTENDEDTTVYGVAENRVTDAGVVVGFDGEIVDEGVVCGSVGPSVVAVDIVVANGVVIGSVADDVDVVVDTVVVVDVVTVVVVVVGTSGTGMWTGLICETCAGPEILERFSNPSLLPKVRQH